MVLKRLQFWPMAMCTFFGSLVTFSFTGLWGGPFFMHVYGMTRTQAGAVLSAMAIGMIIGAPAMSWLSNRVFHSRKKVLALSQLGGLCVFAPLAFFTGDFSETALYIWCFTYNFYVQPGRCRVFHHQGLFPDTNFRNCHGHFEYFPFCRGPGGASRSSDGIWTLSELSTDNIPWMHIQPHSKCVFSAFWQRSSPA